MTEERQSPDEIHRIMTEWWVQTNVGFLFRYWSTARAALEQVVTSPGSYAEFRGEQHISAVVANHLDNHNYSGVLLTYAVFDEFMVVITKMIAKTYRASINAADLKDRGVRRYRKFVHHVCGVPESVLDIDWVFLEDFSTVRNALIHANGNLGLTSNRREMEVVLARYPKLLGLRHSAKIKVSAEFVVQCMVATRAAALALLSADRLKAESDSENT